MIPNQTRALNFGLGETADMIRESVERFSADEIAPRAAAIDASNDFPMDLWPKMGELGILGVTVEEDYGGAAWDFFKPKTHCDAISRAGCGTIPQP